MMISGIKIIITVPQLHLSNNDNCNKNKKYDCCLKPWKSLFIDINETIRIDCYCNIVGKLSGNNNVLSFWNNKNIVNFRKQMLEKGTFICNISCKTNNLDFQRFKL